MRRKITVQETVNKIFAKQFLRPPQTGAHACHILDTPLMQLHVVSASESNPRERFYLNLNQKFILKKGM